MEFPDCRDRSNHDGIGIDLGIKDLAICSDGNTYKNINKSQTVKKLEKCKRRLQRSVSRKYPPHPALKTWKNAYQAPPDILPW